jgi:formylglycine-generating enzyme required for sulfatase activity
VEPEDKTYLILNLNDGSYRYVAAEPEGGWLSDPANYQTNIVFRRIQKGTKKQLGLTDALWEKVKGHFNYEKEHSATLTSDYYISVFMITKGQQEYIIAKGNGDTLDTFEKPRVYGSRKYDELRGSTNETDRINWPHTKHDVAQGTVIHHVREIVKNTFNSEWIVDLPSNVQWEFAAKGTTPFDQLWSVGGKADDENFYVNCTNLLDQIAIWSHNYVLESDKIVGQKAKNGYGLYDIIGLGEEWVADLYKNSPSFYEGTNPDGPEEGTSGYRLIRSVGCEIGNLNRYTTAFATYKKQDSSRFGYRLCINLKSYFDK